MTQNPDFQDDIHWNELQDVSGYERDMRDHSRGWDIGRNIQANRIYQVEGTRDLSAQNFKLLRDIITDHYTNQVPRLAELEMYYEAHNPHILAGERRNQKRGKKADNRATHPFASFISDFMTAYSVGKPMQIRFDNDENPFNDIIWGINKDNETDTLNYQLYLDASKFGRAYELVSFEDGKPWFNRLDPMSTIMIYDTSIKPKPLMALSYFFIPSYGGDEQFTDAIRVEAWTASKHFTWKMQSLGEPLQDFQTDSNKFGQIPVVEYVNNDDRTGDFEKVLPLIDLYDAAQSDTANYMQDFNDAILMLYGDLSGNNLDEKSLDKMLNMNILALQSGYDVDGKNTDVDAKYLQKSMDSSSAELYKTRLQNDIHKFSKVPDFEDGDFSSNTSGVALKYRLYGTLEYAQIQRRHLAHGFHKRYELMTAIMERASDLPSGWDIDNLNIEFVDNLPEDDQGRVDQFIQMQGTLSEETKLKYVAGVFGIDVDDEMERIEGEGDAYESNVSVTLSANEPASDDEAAAESTPE